MLKKKMIALILCMVMSFSVLTACKKENTGDEEILNEQQTSIQESYEKPEYILMLGNSFSYYFVEELAGIAAADGYDITIGNLYESGCLVSEHWTKGVEEKQEFYEEFWLTTAHDRRRASIISFDGALACAEWDVITLQQHFYPDIALDYNAALGATQDYTKQLFEYIKKSKPDANLFWHQTWAFQVGFAVADKYVSTPTKGTPIPDVATQNLTHDNIQKVSKLLAKENGVNLIPSGDAWQIARTDSRVGDNLCARLGVNGDLGDYYHDGDIGGGQYLNACVWYEVLMRESCVGNTWRPTDYELSEEMIAGIQEAAHAAVAAVYGSEYAQ